MKTWVLIASLLAATLPTGCGSEGGDEHNESAETNGHAEEGPNGGHLLEVGSHVAHLEILHDEDAGTLTLHVLGPDGKTPLPISKPPQLKLSTDSGPRVIATKPQGRTGSKASVFAVTDAALKSEPEGRITLEIGGKVYNPELEHDHDH